MVKSSSKVDMGAMGALSLDFRSCNFSLSFSVSFVDFFIAAKCLLNLSAFFWSSMLVSFATFFLVLWPIFYIQIVEEAPCLGSTLFRLPAVSALVFLLAEFIFFLTWANILLKLILLASLFSSVRELTNQQYRRRCPFQGSSLSASLLC